MFHQLTIDGLRGIGQVDLRFDPGHRVRTLFGANGVGKTKCLEGIYQFLLLTNRTFLEQGSRVWPAEKTVMNRAHDDTGRRFEKSQQYIDTATLLAQDPAHLHQVPVLLLGVRFTNEVNLRHVHGVVLIDEIESHLHARWQAAIIPTLKKLLPNTTFFIATHSPLVLTQLEEGEAYLLQRDADGVVRTSVIDSSNRRAFADVLESALDVDLNARPWLRPTRHKPNKSCSICWPAKSSRVRSNHDARGFI